MSRSMEHCDVDGDATEEKLETPARHVTSMTFGDGRCISLSKGEIIVLVGANNSGKSTLLRHLASFLGYEAAVPAQVLASIEIEDNYSAADFTDYITRVSEVTSGNTYSGPGYRYQIEPGARVAGGFRGPKSLFAPYFFGSALFCDNRISGSDAAPSFDRGTGAMMAEAGVTNPIHDMLRIRGVASRVSQAFKAAFGKHLVVYGGLGTSFPLYVSSKSRGELPSEEYAAGTLAAFQAAGSQLSNQGDGMRSFATILLSLFQTEHRSLLLIDEPEAFLHPPQARLIGEMLGRQLLGAQKFIATHSADVLTGLLSSGNKKLRVLRLERRDGKNELSELSSEKLNAIVQDPFTRYSGILQGLFYRHVVVTEGDSDAMFYQSLLNTRAVSDGKASDTLFVHASGKHRLGQMAGVLRDLNIPATVIADIDLLREGDTFRALFEALGGQWPEMEKDWRSIISAIEQPGRELSIVQVKALIDQLVDQEDGNAKFHGGIKRKIADIMRTASPWDNIKRAGRGALPGAPIVKAFDRVTEKCEAVGLLILRVGVLESFCPTVEARKGADFVSTVLSSMDIESETDLDEARDFAKTIWRRVETA